MGNVLSEDFEYKTGKRLISAIAKNSRDDTELAIEYARKECVKPHGLQASEMPYEKMVETMIEYLSRPYKCRDNITLMTPIEFSESQNALESLSVIRGSLASFSSSKINILNGEKPGLLASGLFATQSQIDDGQNRVIPTVTKERALEAKEKLKAFQATRNTRR